MTNTEPFGAAGSGERPVLVNIRCARCWRILASVKSAPDDWSKSLAVPRCPKCDIPKPDRHDMVVIDRWASGLGAGFVAEVLIPWEDLREPIATARRRRGKPTDFPVRVVDTPPEPPRWDFGAIG